MADIKAERLYEREEKWKQLALGPLIKSIDQAGKSRSQGPRKSHDEKSDD